MLTPSRPSSHPPCVSRGTPPSGSGERPLRGLRLLLVLAALAPLVSACAPQTVRGQATPAYRELRDPIRKVAVAPFRLAERLVRRAEPGDDPPTQAALVARHFSEALRTRGVDVVPPNDVAQVLGLRSEAEAGGEPMLPSTLASRMHEEFGVDAVVIGELTRFVERRGQAAGATRPASVGFRVALYAAPGGERLWVGAFEETQQQLTENVLSASRYPGGGMRWLSGEELARWGARETAGAMPLGW